MNQVRSSGRGRKGEFFQWLLTGVAIAKLDGRNTAIDLGDLPFAKAETDALSGAVAGTKVTSSPTLKASVVASVPLPLGFRPAGRLYRQRCTLDKVDSSYSLSWSRHSHFETSPD